ncbi:hypothetical protein ACWD7F_11505 [Streptomyces sp. NPDC005122]
MPASILEGVHDLLEVAPKRRRATRLDCPSRGSVHIAQILGDSGGIPYVCTACGHSWS